ncbi:hypothetical protein EV714DRAFT_271300 [Schizophyllum commune]
MHHALISFATKSGKLQYTDGQRWLLDIDLTEAQLDKYLAVGDFITSGEDWTGLRGWFLPRAAPTGDYNISPSFPLPFKSALDIGWAAHTFDDHGVLLRAAKHIEAYIAPLGLQDLRTACELPRLPATTANAELAIYAARLIDRAGLAWLKPSNLELLFRPNNHYSTSSDPTTSFISSLPHSFRSLLSAESAAAAHFCQRQAVNRLKKHVSMRRPSSTCPRPASCAPLRSALCLRLETEPTILGGLEPLAPYALALLGECSVCRQAMRDADVLWTREYFFELLHFLGCRPDWDGLRAMRAEFGLE